MLRRRQLLRASLGLLATAALPARSSAQTIIASQLLADNLYLFQGAGQNVVVARQPDSLLLVDGGKMQHAAALLDTLSNQFSFLPVHTLINTHWHPEQTGLNALLADEVVDIIAHENTRRHLSATSGATGIPGRTFSTTHTITLGNEQVICGYLPLAHTDGDIYVHFPTRKVLVAGGVLSTNGWPPLDWPSGAWLGGLVAALGKLAALADDNTWIVPATGLPIRRDALLAQHALYQKLQTQLGTMLERGWDIDRVLRAKPIAGTQDWPDQERFLRLAYRSLAQQLALGA